MPKATDHHTPTGFTRRALALASGAVTTVAAPITPSVPEIPATSTILGAAQALAKLVAEYEALCDQPLADENEVIPRMVALEDFIVASQPTTLTEAVILLMHGTDQINRGNAFDDAADQVKLGEYAVRRAMRFLARELRVNLGQFGGSYYAGEHLVPSL